MAVPVYHHGSVFAEYCELVDEERLTKELVLKSLHMACTRRVSRGKMIFHSDRGSQYASSDFRAVLAGDGFRTSMSGKGNCYDNAHADVLVHPESEYTRS